MVDDPTQENPNPQSQEAIAVMLFRVGEQIYCLPVLAVREICRPSKLTPIPHAPPYVLGATNLRGEIPVILDPSLLLGISPQKDNKRRVFMIVDEQEVIFGLLVDEVLGMDSIDGGDITNTTAGQFLKGTCVINGNIVGVLDGDALVRAIKGQF